MADKPVGETPVKKVERKRNIWMALAIAAGVIVFFMVIVGLVAVRLNSKSTDQSQTATTTTKKSTTTTDDTNINQKSTPSITQSAEDAEKYKGWQTYENQSWRVFVRFPAGWTKTETSGSLNVVFLGPPTAGGVILNECVFGIFVKEVPAGTTLDSYVHTAQTQPMGGGTVAEQMETSVGESPAVKIMDTYSDVGAPWKRLRIWTIKNGRAYTFSYTASINYGGTDYYTLHSATADMILASVIIPD
ncbi:MAG: hypothetical protein WC891_04185 [Actinomycetota bacterium]